MSSKKSSGTTKTDTKTGDIKVELASPPAATGSPKTKLNFAGGKVDGSTKARRRNRSQSNGEVPLATFLRASPIKDDELVAFKAWCAEMKHTRMTMVAWRETHASFLKAPVGKR